MVILAILLMIVLSVVAFSIPRLLIGKSKMKKKRKNYESWAQIDGLNFNFSATESAKEIILSGGKVTVSGGGSFNSKLLTVSDNPTQRQSAELSKVSLACPNSELTYFIGGKNVHQNVLASIMFSGKKPVGFAVSKFDNNFKFLASNEKQFQQAFKKPQLESLFEEKGLFQYGWVRREANQIIFASPYENISKSDINRLRRGLALIDKLSDVG